MKNCVVFDASDIHFLFPFPAATGLVFAQTRPFPLELP
ncbi:hypothetical protein NY78_3404 [Desulfovibrio sp. TomC]|nr:hypothetical protein NY78_3404 [Desulfovibrio sp. TomC]